MAGELYCPDCGGVVGAAETTEAGRPCSCFRSSGTGSVAAVDIPAPVGETQKICIFCGKDLTGQRRVKDSRGYLCPECSEEEDRRERGDRVRCPGCRRLIEPSALIDEDGSKFCERCIIERKKARLKRIERLGIRGARTRYEKSRLYVIFGIVAFLLLIILLNRLHVLPNLF